MPHHPSRYVVIGAGVHGLSTAWHLARHADVVVLDKSGVGAGASGIACGIVRNNYAQPAMRELMAHSVAVWESDPEAFHYHPVGYLQAAPEVMHNDVARIHAEQAAIGYPSTLVEGEAACRRYLGELFGDWRASGITTVLHEQRGGFANNLASMHGLAAKARAAGAEIRTGTEITGFDLDGSGAVTAVRTAAETIECDQVVVAVGPWIRDLWALLGLPDRIEARGDAEPVPMWRYLVLQEGTIDVDPRSFTDARGNQPPVMHVDSDQPLYDDQDRLVTDQLWGVYYKPDDNFGGVQGGSMPVAVGKETADVTVDPYSQYTAGPEFARLWTAALAHCHDRFTDAAARYRHEPSGGLGCFTPDSFPVFDRVRENAYVIADSNHGYKMLGVGDLVAGELLGGRSTLLDPFRLDRFARGETHPTSHSPFPWS